MIRFLAAGDTHADNQWLSTLILKYAVNCELDIIFQLGDFGVTKQKSSQVFLDRTSSKLQQVDKKLFFLDGNHDDHPYLWENYPPGQDGFCEVRENIYYSPRGHAFTWGGVRFLTLGGAYSVDKDSRVEDEQFENRPGWYWYPTELITAEERDFAISQGKVDVMLTHDCPWGVKIPRISNMFWESNENRRQLAEVVKACKPDLLVHGHYHTRVTDVFEWADPAKEQTYSTRIEGLSCNPSVSGSGRDAWSIIDLTPENEVSSS